MALTLVLQIGLDIFLIRVIIVVDIAMLVYSY